jgi:nucleotide-binding universal stress UspA family protein
MAPDTDTDIAPIRSILVATDFSAHAVNAMNWAVALATRHRARMVLAHAVDVGLLPRSEANEDQALVDARRQMTVFAAAADETGLAVETSVETGPPWEVVLDAIDRFRPDLVVVGSHGRTSLEGVLLGSTADRVIRAALVPVVTVHPGDNGTTPTLDPILVASDLSEESMPALDTALRLVETFDPRPRIVLLHSCMFPIVFPDLNMTAELVETEGLEEEERSRIELEAIAAPLRDRGLDVETRIYRGYPVNAIEQESTRLRPGLISLGTSGRSGLGRMLIGSVAERVVHRAKCPVMTVRHSAD